jgi:hypothetical protein
MVNADKPPLYIVMTAQAQTPASKGIHRTVAVVKTDEETYPKLLAFRARGVVDIVWRSPPLRTCKPHRGAYQAALAYAKGLAADLNATTDWR